MSPEPRDRFWGYEIGAVSDLADQVKSAFRELEDPAAAAMGDFDDRDLVLLAESAGFDRVHLECHIDVEPGSLMGATNLEMLLNAAPNPLAATVGESIDAALTGAERERFLAHLQRAIADGRAVRRSAVAYLSARKP